MLDLPDRAGSSNRGGAAHTMVLFCLAFRRLRHVVDLQVLNDNHRVFFYFSGDFVNVVFAAIGDILV